MYNFSKHIPHSNQLFSTILRIYACLNIKKICYYFEKTLAFSE